MSDKDLFDDGEKDDKAADLTKDDNQKHDDVSVEQLLKGIVNEDGEPKYKTEAEALKALAHSQAHIKSLEADNAALKDKDTATDKLDELLEAVKSKASGKDESEDKVSALKPEDVLGIVKEYLTDTEAATSRADNIKLVTNTFKERFGKDASEKLYGTANDLGFSRSEINQMIATNPNATLKVLGVDVKAKPKIDPTTMQTSVDAGQFRHAPETAPKSIMGISSSKDLTDAWAASKERTLKRLEG